MKKQCKRWLILVCCVCCLLFALPQTALAVTDIAMEDSPWNHVWIYANDEIVVPNVVIIYLHGDGNSGYGLKGLEKFPKVDHPLRYARNDTLPLPDDTIFICPQSGYDGEFRFKQEELTEFIHMIAEAYPDALIILSGHSHGSLASYVMAANGNDDVDGYVFISGIRPPESEEISLMQNCLVVFGDETWLSKRGDYSNLFLKTDISDMEYRKECTYLEEESNNGYIRGRWGHGDAPKVFLEDFFWEWLNNISYN